TVTIAFANRGAAGAVFQVHPGPGLGEPRHYTVEAGKTSAGVWIVPADQDGCELTVTGPGGFFRCFQGVVAASRDFPEITAAYDPSGKAITLAARNRGVAVQALTVAANAYGAQAPHACAVAAGASGEDRWDLTASRGWYDLTVTSADLPGCAWRFAGHVENGADSVTDPAMGALIAALPFALP
ncbi:MAG: DUF756 domain-containing protein, partial [Planctomycetes bacterium]|nr:DUF756 domain-containing protein [Planctomycetota bacterium]